MDASTKLYSIALKKYQNGYIDQAIEMCEKSISSNLKNTAAINLKGLLFYLKGELETAKKLWKLNFEVYKDEVSGIYLENSKNDKERQFLYNQAIKYIMDVNIIAAIENLKKCEISDYNSINVNNYLAVCYIKMGEYNNALTCIKKVLVLDMKNKMAKENLKILKKFGGISIPMNRKSLIYISMVSIAIVLVVILGIIGVSKIKIVKSYFNQSTDRLKVNKNNKQKNIDKKSALGDKVQSSAIVPKVEETFPYDQIKAAIYNKDMAYMYENTKKWNGKELKAEYRGIIAKEEQLLKTEGVSYFYKLGTTQYVSGDMEKAKQSLLIAYELGTEDMLYPHVVYTLGNTFEKANDLQNAFKYYEEYDAKYPKGNYEEDVLYKLATLNKNINNEKAKIYAGKLEKEYPDSKYINTIITWILSQ